MKGAATMGGRGGSSNGASKQYAAAYATPKALAPPKLIGSEKQIKWANDIISSPYKIYDNTSKAALEQAKDWKRKGISKILDPDHLRRAEVYAAARDLYAEAVAKLREANPDGLKAGWVIDNRFRFKAVARKAFEAEFQKRKKARSDWANEWLGGYSY